MEQIAINILPKGAKPVCHSSQFDEGRQIMFNLFNDKTPYTLSGTETISVLVRKPDGTEIIDSVTNTSDSYVVWDVSADACELSGVCECEFSIVDNGTLLGSKNFTMKVEEDAYGGKNIEVRTASGRIATFSTNMVEAFKSLKTEINPVQSGTGTPSPSNVRPISGFSALNVTRTSVNLWDEQTRNGYYKTDGTFQSYSGNLATVNPIRVMPNTNYRLLVSGGTGAIGRVCWYDVNGNFISTQVPQQANIVLTSPANAYYLNFDLTGAYGTTYGNNVAVLYPSTQTTFEPYNGQTAIVNFGQTVYGGSLDVTNGKLIVTKIARVFDGSENFLTLASGRVFAYDFGVNLVGSFNNNNSLCSHFHTGYGSWDLLGVGEYLVGGGHYGGVNPDMTLADYKTYLQAQYNNGTPVTLVATLATPIEITTTPENLTALSGQNNVYGDTNGDTEVEYYIEV